jgi:putative MATE family efflux protein
VGTLDVLLIAIFTSLASGGSIVISQFLGKKDIDSAKKACKQLIYVTATVAAVISISVIALRHPLLNALYGSAEHAVLQSAKDYFLYIAISFTFLGIFNAGAAIFRAMGNTTIPLCASLLVNIVNLFTNAIFIYLLHMGAAGVAIATLIARIVGVIVIIPLLYNKKNPIFIEKIYMFKPDKEMIKSILHIGVPSGLENSSFQFGRLLVQSLVSTLPTVSITANAIANSIANILCIPSSSIGISASPIVGRCVGAGEKEQAKKYSKILLLFSYISLLAIVILTFVFAKPVISIYGLTDESSRLALKLILYHGICATIIWPVAFMLPQVFRAASDVKFTLVVSMISMWIFRVALSYPLTLDYGLGLGAMGVWIAMTIDWLFRFIVFAIHFVRGRWLTKYKPTLKI